MSNILGSLTAFDHNSQEWEIFKSRLVQYVKLNKVTEDNKCALLLTHLSDETYRLVRNLVHPKKVEDSKFEELVAALDKQLAPKRCIFVERAKFYEATRDVAENIEQWAARISELAVRCEFGAPLDELLRDRFVLGLSVGPERDRLFEQDAATLTFAKAVEVAQKAAYARSARTTSVPAAVVQVKQEPMYRVGTSRPGTGGSSDSRRCSVCGLKSHDASKCKYKNYRCQVCGQKGHLKKVCSAEKAKQCRVNCIQADLDGSAEVSQSAEGCKECELFNLRYVNNAPILLEVDLNGKNLTMELDCGSGPSVISDKLYYKTFSDCKLKKCDMRMCFYNGHQVAPLGYFTTKITYLKKTHDIDIYVMEDGSRLGLLGRDFMTKFNMYFAIDEQKINFVSSESFRSELPRLLSEYSSLFNEDLGKFNKFQVELKLKDNVTPKFFKPRTVPFAIKNRVEEEIDRLVGLGILVPVNFSKYATPIVPVLKDNGKIKIAGDFSVTLNKDMIIDRYPMPRIEEVFARLGGGNRYTKLDLSNAYNQFVLSDDSQELTTINTSKGLYKYTRLVYGLANAPAIFQRTMETLLVGIEGVSCWLDDVCVTGPTDELHLSRLREVLKRFL
ncbi:uncharacterized protein K02A2.6-like [Cydia splendana]|uniref:uncharacterized protein K02A2.6-like n=1 Tax=Cydia splendana TaxID=1100963 RepID=UPI00300CB17F